jgi:hypothetical protein
MYSEIRTKFAQITTPYLTLQSSAFQFSVDFQPLPSIFGTHSARKGSNAISLTANDPDRLILDIQGSWILPSDDALGYSLSKQLTDWLEKQVPLWLDEAGMDRNMYLPLFINDAAGDQGVFQSYRDYEKFKALQKSVDPKGMFRTRAGGFKY